MTPAFILFSCCYTGNKDRVTYSSGMTAVTLIISHINTFNNNILFYTDWSDEWATVILYLILLKFFQQH